MHIQKVVPECKTIPLEVYHRKLSNHTSLRLWPLDTGIAIKGTLITTETLLAGGWKPTNYLVIRNNQGTFAVKLYPRLVTALQHHQAQVNSYVSIRQRWNGQAHYLEIECRPPDENPYNYRKMPRGGNTTSYLLAKGKHALIGNPEAVLTSTAAYTWLGTDERRLKEWVALEVISYHRAPKKHLRFHFWDLVRFVFSRHYLAWMKYVCHISQIKDHTPPGLYFWLELCTDFPRRWHLTPPDVQKLFIQHELVPTYKAPSYHPDAFAHLVIKDDQQADNGNI